jgi:hypothetical protein
MGGIKFSDAGNGGGVVGAANGLSLDALNRVVLGQDLADPLNPAALTSNREIPLLFFLLRLLGYAGSNAFINFGFDSVLSAQFGIEVAGDSSGGEIPHFQLSDPVGSPNNQFYAWNLQSEVLFLTTALGNVLNIAPASITANRALRVSQPISGGRFVVDNAANFNATGMIDSRTVYTNRGAPGAITASIFGSVGNNAASYIFYNVTGNAFNIQAAAGTTIRNGALLKAAPGILTSNAIGSCIELVAIGNNEWIATQVIGAWV